MPDLAALEGPALAVALENAITRLGQLGPGGLNAINEFMATRSDSADFDRGIDLLDGWIGDPD